MVSMALKQEELETEIEILKAVIDNVVELLNDVNERDLLN